MQNCLSKQRFYYKSCIDVFSDLFTLVIVFLSQTCMYTCMFVTKKINKKSEQMYASLLSFMYSFNVTFFGNKDLKKAAPLLGTRILYDF